MLGDLWKRRDREVLLIDRGPRRRARQKLVRRVRRGIAALGLVTLISLSLVHSVGEAHRRAALTDLERIADAARLFRQDHGRCPRDLDELERPPAGATGYMSMSGADPWGRTYFFQCPGRWSESSVDVGTPGPDGSWGGGDDVTTDL